MSFGTDYSDNIKGKSTITWALSSTEHLRHFYKNFIIDLDLRKKYQCVVEGSIYYFISISNLMAFSFNELRTIKSEPNYFSERLTRESKYAVQYSTLSKEEKEQFHIFKKHINDLNMYYSYLKILEQISDKYEVRAHTLTNMDLVTDGPFYFTRMDLDRTPFNIQQEIRLSLKHLIAPSLEAKIGEILLVYAITKEQ